jgi:predicted AAA+ superfamily ATPase
LLHHVRANLGELVQENPENIHSVENNDSFCDVIFESQNGEQVGVCVKVNLNSSELEKIKRGVKKDDEEYNKIYIMGPDIPMTVSNMIEDMNKFHAVEVNF